MNSSLENPEILPERLLEVAQLMTVAKILGNVQRTNRDILSASLAALKGDSETALNKIEAASDAMDKSFDDLDLLLRSIDLRLARLGGTNDR